MDTHGLVLLLPELICSSGKLWFRNVGHRIQIEGRPVQSPAALANQFALDLHTPELNIGARYDSSSTPLRCGLVTAVVAIPVFSFVRPNKKGMNDHIATGCTRYYQYYVTRHDMEATVLVTNMWRRLVVHSVIEYSTKAWACGCARKGSNTLCAVWMMMIRGLGCSKIVVEVLWIL